MKEKRKKIIARISAMVAAILLVVLCALPAFADGVETRTTTAYDNYLSTIGATADDAIYHLMRDNTGYNPMTGGVVYQFGINTAGMLPAAQYITWEGVTTAMKSVVTAYNTDTQEVIHFPNGVWRTSHTTTSGNKYVYLDYYEVSLGGTAARLFRIRYKYVEQQLSEVQVTANYSQYEGLQSNISTWQFASTVGNYGFVLEYAVAQNFIKPVGGLPFYNSYNNYQTIYNGAYNLGATDGFNQGYDNGYDNGYSEGYENGENVGLGEGYNSGFNDGLYEGEQNGYDWGYQEGYGIGYNEGRNTAHDEGLGKSTTAIVDLVTAIFRAPMEFLDEALDFTILGVNMATAVRVLLSMAIIGVVATIIWKAVK